MKRVVCDTNVMLSGMLWNGAPRQVLTRIEQGKIILFTSRDLLEELDHVLRYAKFALVFGRTGIDRQDILRWMARNSTLIMAKPLDRTVVTADPSDDDVLACAASASAEAVISGDKHLLDIHSFRGIPILSADRFLRKLRERRVAD